MLWSVIRLIFKTSSVTPDFFYVFNLILSFLLGVKVLKKFVLGNFWARTSLIQMFMRNFVFQKALKTRHIVNIKVDFEATYCSKFSTKERILSGKS